MSVAEEIIRQRAQLKRERREPAEIWLGLDQWYEMLCDSRVRMGHDADHACGEFYGLPLRPRPNEMVRVIPLDWGGYGQGGTRA